MSGVLKSLTSVVKTPLSVLSAVTGRDARKAQADAQRAQNEALAQQAEIAAQQAAQQKALQNMQANAQLDLRTDNLTSVLAGGSADLLGTDATGTKKRKATGGLASSLGLNV